MRDVLLEAACIALLFGLVKYVEARFIKKTPANTKTILRDGVLVCLSSAGALVLTSYLGLGTAGSAPTQAFTGKPEF